MARTVFSMETLSSRDMQWFAKPPKTHPEPTQSLLLEVSRCFNPSKRQKNSFYGQRVNASRVIEDWVLNNGSTVYVSEHIAKATEQTDLPEDLCGSDLKVALPHIYFVLPRMVDGVEIDFTDNLVKITKNQDGVKHIEIVSCNRKTDYATLTISYTSVKLKPELTLIQSMTEEAKYNRMYSDTSVCMTADHKLTIKLFLNLLLVMQNKPKYKMELEKDPNQVRSKRSENSNNFVLARSSVKSLEQVVTSHGCEDHGGTHASPRMHWRRGHWRRSRHGDLWELQNPDITPSVVNGVRYHLNWIEPVLVLGMSEEPSVVSHNP